MANIAAKPFWSMQLQVGLELQCAARLKFNFSEKVLIFDFESHDNKSTISFSQNPYRLHEYQGKVANLEEHGFGSLHNMRTSCLDTDFVSQIKLT